MKSIYKVLFTLLFTIFISFSFSQTAEQEEIIINKYEEFALFVTGKEYPKTAQDTNSSQEFWLKYQEKINEDWPNMDSTRLTPMSIWRNDEVKDKINDSLLLFYPFSGPDFLHAYVLFPQAPEYVFFAQEILGSIPDFSKYSNKDMEEYLDKFYYAIRDIYARSYFITGRMGGDLNNAKVKGTLPIFIFFMAQTNHYIHDVKYEYVNSKGEIMPLQKVTGKYSSAECINISFSKIDDPENIKTLRYFRCDLSDEGLNEAPGFKKYLENIGDRNTYVKSASYLLHYGTFSSIRNIVLNTSKAVLQDDTGVPYRYFLPKNWEAFLYGEYVKPISDFPSTYLMQKDLKEIYDKKGENIKELPFSLGYHWRSGEQNQMLFIKK